MHVFCAMYDVFCAVYDVFCAMYVFCVTFRCTTEMATSWHISSKEILILRYVTTYGNITCFGVDILLLFLFRVDTRHQEKYCDAPLETPGRLTFIVVTFPNVVFWR